MQAAAGCGSVTHITSTTLRESVIRWHEWTVDTSFSLGYDYFDVHFYSQNIAPFCSVCCNQVTAMLKQFDKDGNGTLDYGEFTCFYAEAKARYNNV